MAITNLTFTKDADNGSYAAKFTSTGPVSVQIKRKDINPVIVSANIPGMSPCIIGTYHNNSNPDIVIGIDIPAGMEVTLRCGSQVLEAKMMTDE